MELHTLGVDAGTPRRMCRKWRAASPVGHLAPRGAGARPRQSTEWSPVEMLRDNAGKFYSMRACMMTAKRSCWGHKIPAGGGQKTV